MAKSLETTVHHYVSLVLKSTGNSNLKSGIYNLKNELNFNAKCLAVMRLGSVSPVFNRYIFGNPVSRSIEKLGVSKNNFYSKDLIIELDWFLLSARKYKTELSLFLLYKKDFENFFLLGSYGKARECIEKAEEVVGVSIWSISSKFLIYEYTASQGDSKLLQTEILDKNLDGVFTSSLVNFISQRSERGLSAYRFDSDLESALNNVHSNVNLSNKDYYNFQLNFFEKQKFTELKEILGFDYVNSIADRYLTFRRMVIYCLSNGIFVDEIVARVNYLSLRISDDIFGTTQFLYNDDYNNKEFFDSSHIEIIDLYYAGLYDEVCEKVKLKVSSMDVDFGLINIYARSLVLGGKVYTPILSTPSLVNEISENIFKIYKRASNPSEALYRLYQVLKNIDFFDISYALNTYVKTEQNIPCNRHYLYMTVKKADPIISELFSKEPRILEVLLERMEKRIGNSLSIAYRKGLIKGKIENVSGVDLSKKEIDAAKLLFRSGSYDAALDAWLVIYQKSEDITPVLEAATEYVYRILWETNKYDDCIKWYVDSVIKNPFLVYKLDASDVHKALKKGRFKNVKNNIYLPIFVSLVSSDENEKSFAIEMFCKVNGAVFPSDYMNNENFNLDAYNELFFFYSCNNETLKYYKHLNTTKKRLDERINICNFLAKKYQQSNDKYIQELNLLTNELIIHEGTQKLDESKIYANDQAILSNDLDEYEGLYNRYVTIAGLVLKNVKILTINKNELRFLDKKGTMEYSQNEVEYSSHAELDSFNSVFSVIREKFLFSKFGIVTYLSTRIRHGVLLGELRPELERNNLIFLKNKLKDTYEPDSFWLNNSNLSDIQKEGLIDLITNFSSKIDTLINKIIKENIQIKLNGDFEEGWFDYEFSAESLAAYSITLYYEENYEAFCKKVLEILWKRTDENLDRIRRLLQDQVKNDFVTIMNDFEGALRVIVSKEKMPEIFTVVTSCSTNIQNRLDKIATWFKRSGKTHKDFQIKMLMDIICLNVQRAHPSKTLEVNSKYPFNPIIKGEFYEHFNDFIRIFIENMLKHTPGNEVITSIVVQKNGESLEMIFENANISQESEAFIESVKEIDGLKLITEGKSGLIKALKIIKDDLRCQQNNLYFRTVDGNFQVSAFINYNQLIA